MSPRALFCIAALLVGCGDAGERREWTPTDHRGEQRARGQVSANPEGADDASLVAFAWRQNCAACHGLDGRGQTQQGQMLRVPDLSRPELSGVADDALAATIRRGRNQMPAFSSLPDSTVAGLVRTIRSFAR